MCKENSRRKRKNAPHASHSPKTSTVDSNVTVTEHHEAPEDSSIVDTVGSSVWPTTSEAHNSPLPSTSQTSHSPLPRTSQASNSPSETTSQDELNENTDVLCKSCWTEDRDTEWILCDNCSSWLHRVCAGLRHHTKWKKFQRKGAVFFCNECQ